MRDNILLTIAEDFSDAPGARNPDDGPDSGEDFYNKVLRDAFQSALSNGVKLIVNMDGTYGYATSFISESFGSLSTEFSASVVLDNLELISLEDPGIKKYTIDVIKNPSPYKI